TESVTYQARAIGAARIGDAAAAKAAVEEIAKRRDALREAKNDYWATEAEVMRLTGAAWATFADSRADEALGLMRQAADLEDKNDKHPVTPGRILPARELLGDLLMEMKRPAEALKEYELSQVREPNRFRGIYGAALAAEMSGEDLELRQYLAPDEERGLARLAEIVLLLHCHLVVGADQLECLLGLGDVASEQGRLGGHLRIHLVAHVDPLAALLAVDPSGPAV